jgi:hypothetical protein
LFAEANAETARRPPTVEPEPIPWSHIKISLWRDADHHVRFVASTA